MNVIVPGHHYELPTIRPDNTLSDVFHPLVFVAKEPHKNRYWTGVQTQEVIRALIDRTYYCHTCLPHQVNPRIVQHLRMALALHEARAIERKAEKGIIHPEHVSVSRRDGHYLLSENTIAAFAGMPMTAEED